MKRAIATFAALLLLASAEAGYCGEQAKPAGERSWYGGQILVADGLASLLFLGSLGGGAVPLAFVGYGAYALVPPVIHGRHRQPGSTVMSLGLRVVLPLVGFAVASGRAGCSHSEDEAFCQTIGGLPGFGIGVLVATIVDAAFLSWDSRPAPPLRPTPVTPRRSQTVSLSSVGVVPTSSGASLVLGGWF